MTPNHMCGISENVTPDDSRTPLLSDATGIPNHDETCRTDVNVPRKINAPRYTSHGFPTDTCNTFCILAGFDRYDKVGHSAALYYKCSECSMYICHVCKKRIFSESLGAPCCQNFILESNPYTGSLNPK